MNKESQAAERTQIDNVLVIDDHPLFCEALVICLQRVCGAKNIITETCLRDGLKSVAQKQFDLIILDLKLPDVTGMDGLQQMRERVPDIPILVISADSSPATIAQVMGQGVVGYVLKEAPLKDLQKALKDISEGKKVFPNGYTMPAKEAPALDTNHTRIAQNLLEQLTPQQAKIADLICAGKPNKVIAYELSLAEATVKAHVTALLRRLGVTNRTQAALILNATDIEKSITVDSLHA